MMLASKDSVIEAAKDFLNEIGIVPESPPSSFFDGLQYIASYGDLIRAFGANEPAGRQHYEQFGQAEGREADTFDEDQYLANYPDLQAVFGNDTEAATVHYIQYGFAEGRTDVDGLQYIASHEDLIQAFGANEPAGEQHWLTFGRRRDAKPTISMNCCISPTTQTCRGPLAMTPRGCDRALYPVRFR